MSDLRGYTRWTADTGGTYTADILTNQFAITVYPGNARVALAGVALSLDEARLMRVRLIEGAALADGNRSIRQAGES